MKQPDHAAGDAFEKARQEIEILESQLNKPQRQFYDQFLKQQDKAREQQQEKATAAKMAYDTAKTKADREHARLATETKISELRLSAKDDSPRPPHEPDYKSSSPDLDKALKKAFEDQERQQRQRGRGGGGRERGR